jgi:predicted adenylyl cyclase CyaB
MARNVEIKARVSSVAALAEKVSEIADSGPTTIVQDDTFFRCETGRLKLRRFSDGSGELIYYRRPDRQAPKESFYLRSHTTEPLAMEEALTLAYGKRGRVKKRRTLFLVGRTRVHLDIVEQLGDFLELEVVLEEKEPPESGIHEARQLMHRLGIQAAQLVEGAYIDLLEKEAERVSETAT